ncbi:YqjF family protein [Bythopirellula goksoeyrii]|uniref:DUF2071 domain-containing protein n=1 Tax=Bythopirellula goksoeyrii TaxID=1400387 RepID=A0A5B9Q1Y4_9BACT|nr:DUF2071 domain-containing protein [Bythopirellula goksoeyrii]QEG32964.1 hypothetical protein Pr1d_02250 [Bythopirellula goksoeyrii]
MTKTPFLTTRWSYLAMLNYEIDPQVLRSFVPPHTELDSFNHRHYVSMVGFLYDDTRIKGLAIPGHRQFAEVNLRFYVRYQAAEGWRRGVVFIREVVPRRAVAWIARKLYEEKFVCLPMRHVIKPSKVEYSWWYDGAWQRLAIDVTGDAELPAEGSEEEFITEHYWGYTARRDGSTSEYRVAHPRWRVRQTGSAVLDCKVNEFYGAEFAEALSGTPTSAFLAEGSAVEIYAGCKVL